MKRIVVIMLLAYSCMSYSQTFDFFTYNLNLKNQNIYSSPLLFNPAYTGTTEKIRMGLHHFNNNAAAKYYCTNAITVDSYVTGMNSGLGFCIVRDDQSVNIYNQRYGAFYSYVLDLNNKWQLRTGVNGNYSISTSTEQVIMGISTNYKDKIKYFDMVAGFAAVSSRADIGLTIRNINEPITDFDVNDTYVFIQDRGYLINAGYKVINKKHFKSRIAGSLYLMGNMEYYILKSESKYMDVYFSYSHAWNNLIHNVNHIGEIGYQQKNISFIYGINVGYSKLFNTTTTGHYLTLIIKAPHKWMSKDESELIDFLEL